MRTRGAVYASAVAGVLYTSPLPACCPTSEHDALKADPARWEAAHFVGIQRGLPGDPEPPLELRDCPECQSTLGVVLDERK
jgi:hypothetical protein